MTSAPSTSLRPVLPSWCVHAYTGTGVVLAMLMVMAAWDGDVTRALWLAFIALVVDGTDGMLARRVDVKRHLPWFDGAMLDNIVDYLTYTFAPMVLLWSNGYLGGGLSATLLTVVPLVASSYQFCRVDAKTEDHMFLGFPSYWNVVAFYIIVGGVGPVGATVLLLTCSVLVFVPVTYVYPSRTLAFRRLTLTLTAVWLVSYAVMLADVADAGGFWLWVSLSYLVYYAGLSLHLTVRRRTTPSVAEEPVGA